MIPHNRLQNCTAWFFFQTAHHFTPSVFVHRPHWLLYKTNNLLNCAHSSLALEKRNSLFGGHPETGADHLTVSVLSILAMFASLLVSGLVSQLAVLRLSL